MGRADSLERICGGRPLVRCGAGNDRRRRRGQRQRLIPKIQHVIENYKFRSLGDYSAWPGPNSNTFVQAVLDAVPELKAVLPPTAIGKDYPYEGEWLGITPSRTGIYASLGGYLGLTIGWVEGIELNFFGAVLGVDVRRPALKITRHWPAGLTRRIVTASCFRPSDFMEHRSGG